MTWGLWEEGGRYDVRVGKVTWLSEYRGRISVEVRDKFEGKNYRRVGDVRIIGNLSPVWINFKGRKIQLTELLKVERKHRGMFI